ncbi:unnamed protein product [Blepharisma stoltei]|uniref:PX domain-containing protein n=1 Tax=Blepharisma stoltei TaxID=1481888 RepID=A0AAU9ILP9_9CILI|nr:unnamed protein product [Blepharisma stoltei]
MSHTIKITKFDVSDHTEYTFLVFSHHDEGIWHFRRRYSNLFSFHEALSQVIKSPLPIFPQKKFFCRLSLSFIETRQKALQTYFTEITKIPEVFRSKAFKTFIKPDDRVMVENPKEKKPVQFERRSEIEIYKQLENQYRVIMESYTLRVIDLSFIANPPNEEDIIEKQNSYRDIIKKIEIEEAQTSLPEGDEDNKEFLEKPVGSYEWMDTKIDLLSKTIEICHLSCENLLNKI